MLRPAEAAITVRAVSTADNATGSTSIALTMPTGATANDVLVAVITVRGGTGVTISPPSGWTQRTTNDSTTVLKSATFTGTQSSVGSGPYTFTLSSSQKAAAVVVAYSGVDTTNPVNASGSQANASSTTMTSPAVSSTVANAMVVGLYGNAVATTFSAGSGMALEGQVSSSGGGGGTKKVTTGVQDILQASTGTTGTKTMTASTGAVSVGHTLALRPATVVSQSAYRFFVNTNSTTVSTPYAATNQTATIPKQTPFRLRLNLGIDSSGADLTVASGATFELYYAELTEANCAVQSFYGNVTSVGNVGFYNNSSVADGAAYVANATYDPTRSGITPIGQKYHEANPLSVANNAVAGQDALWDIALTTSASVAPGETYCIKAINLNGTYSVYAQFTIAAPTVTQANYRFFANANQTTPGSPLSSQDAVGYIAPQTPFRLRQRLAVDSLQLGASELNYKLQFAEKVGTCDIGFTGETYADVMTPPAGGGATGSVLLSSATRTASQVTKSGSTFSWSQPARASGSNNSYASAVPTTLNDTTHYLQVAADLPVIPDGAIIKGIKVNIEGYTNMSLGGGGDIDLFLDGVGPLATKSFGLNFTDSITSYGSSTDTWGVAWSAAQLNSAGAFQVRLWSGLTVDSGNGIFIDDVDVEVFYEESVQTNNALSYNNNAIPADGATISSTANDPANAGRSTVYQTYRETDPFTNNVAAIPAGSDGMWDFSLTSSAIALDKTYCLRVVKSTGSLLNTYARLPEITFSAGGGPTGPTLDQQMRGGGSVINGTKGNLIW